MGQNLIDGFPFKEVIFNSCTYTWERSFICKVFQGFAYLRGSAACLEIWRRQK